MCQADERLFFGCAPSGNVIKLKIMTENQGVSLSLSKAG